MISLVTTAVGSGILSLPWAFSKCGLVLGTVLLACGGVASFQSLKLLANVGYTTGKRNYTTVVEATLGVGVAALVQAILFIYAMGAVIGFYIFLGTMLPTVMKAFHAPAVMQNRTYILLIV